MNSQLTARRLNATLRKLGRRVNAITPHHERPCAAAPWHSYRYRGNYGWVMIGALSHAEALSEAARSVRWHEPTMDRLEVWNGATYEPATPDNEPA